MKTGQEDEAPRAEELDEKWSPRAGTGLTQSNHRCKKFTRFANFNSSPKAAITIIKIFANPWIQWRFSHSAPCPVARALLP